MLIIGLAAAAVLVLLAAGRQWSSLNTDDLGSMSEQWLAEHNSSHRG